ncbi:oxalate decarboxylase, secreted [Cercospora zeina]
MPLSSLSKPFAARYPPYPTTIRAGKLFTNYMTFETRTTSSSILTSRSAMKNKRGRETTFADGAAKPMSVRIMGLILPRPELLLTRTVVMTPDLRGVSGYQCHMWQFRYAKLACTGACIPKGFREIHEPNVLHHAKRQEAQKRSPPDFTILDTLTKDPIGPAGASGSLRGSPSLAGYNSAYRVDTSLPATVPEDQYQPAPGQEEDSCLGLYLDLASVENPQPIRGSTNAPTDPGPRNRVLDQ